MRCMHVACGSKYIYTTDHVVTMTLPRYISLMFLELEKHYREEVYRQYIT